MFVWLWRSCNAETTLWCPCNSASCYRHCSQDGLRCLWEFFFAGKSLLIGTANWPCWFEWEPPCFQECTCSFMCTSVSRQHGAVGCRAHFLVENRAETYGTLFFLSNVAYLTLLFQSAQLGIMHWTMYCAVRVKEGRKDTSVLSETI